MDIMDRYKSTLIHFLQNIQRRIQHDQSAI
jgi:hypothetical protein